MNRNNEYRFGIAPTVTTPRSTFTMHQNIRTTFNAGNLIPFYVDSDIMPGDTFKIDGTFVVRQSTPIYPTMDNSFLDVFFFFIPHRLVWDHWKEFWGENTTGAWTQTTSYQIPQLKIATTSVAKAIEKGDSLQYMGIPILSQTKDGLSINALPWRGLALTWNEWFRDENMAPPLNIYKGDNDTYYTDDINGNTNISWGNYDTTYTTLVPSSCPPVYKYKDYFNACLPEPQKGDPITLPIGNYAPLSGLGKAYGTGKTLGITEGTGEYGFGTGGDGTTLVYPGNSDVTLPASNTGSKLGSGHALGLTTDKDKSGIVVDMTGVTADLANAVAATINAQRFAFAAQRILEQKARTGTRYTEIVRGFFGVTSPDARQQRPEYLGGKRIPITMNQVAQTSSTDSTSPQGNVSAFSLTVDSDRMFTKSFTEHGTILGLLCVRQEHSYDQGIARQWSRKDVLDFYTPQQAFLGEQSILNKELYATGTSTDDQVFGFNERWAELRYKPNINTGSFSTQAPQSLDSWHYGDSYSALPVLSDAWRRETKDYIDRTLAVSSAVSDQYLMDSRLELTATRCVPMVSVPGLLDHF